MEKRIRTTPERKCLLAKRRDGVWQLLGSYQSSIDAEHSLIRFKRSMFFFGYEECTVEEESKAKEKTGL